VKHGGASQHSKREHIPHRPESSTGQLSLPGAQFIPALWRSARVIRLRALVRQWMKKSSSAKLVLLIGTVLATLLIVAVNSIGVALPDPGLVYLPLVAMLAYHWGWRYAALAAILELLCVYFFFIPPLSSFKPLRPQGIEQLVLLAAVTSFMLALVQLARYRRAHAEQAAERFAALNRVGTAVMSELEEMRLLHLIAETARDLTGAEFAAFTLRPVNELGRPLVPSEGSLFHLAAVVGVTKEQEALLRRMRLGGEGLLAPIFRYAVPVRVPDALALVHQPEPAQRSESRAASTESRDAARQTAFEYAHGQTSRENLRSLGVPRGHPMVRSFLGAPLLDHTGQVRGGLLLGSTLPDQFTHEDEELLVGLAAQAAVALENARLYHAAQMQAQELDTIFESIADGITLVGPQGEILRENGMAHHLREALEQETTEGTHTVEALLHDVADHALRGETEHATPLTIADAHKEPREYLVSASPLLPSTASPSAEQQGEHPTSGSQKTTSGAVVVWHDVTEAHRLLVERQAHAGTEARRALLQLILDELPSSVYLVRGKDARLVLANRATTEVWGARWSQGQPMTDFLKQNGIRIFGIDGHPLAPGELATLRVLQNGETVRHHQELIRHRDGTSLPVLVNAVALDPYILSPLDPTGSETQEGEPAAIVVHQDVTPLKEAERIKDEFIGIAAHELRNPLAVLKGYAQMLVVQTARGRGPQLADWQTESIEAIDQATARLVDLTEDLLDVTRLQAGRFELHPAPTDLLALTERVVARLRVTSERHTISLHTPSEYIVSLVDASRMEQILNNLINNAIKYSPQGGNIEISVRPDTETNTAVVCVRDYGIGIPAHQQARIFSRFVRADNARALGIGGTGLGLYLCRELVERQGGRIWFESVEGQGSTFFVALPLVPNSPPNGKPATHDTPMVGKGKREECQGH
jgi:two-component system phosphate regulon sensor histidine kinase PhoR